jgi:hypothetical protein
MGKKSNLRIEVPVRQGIKKSQKCDSNRDKTFKSNKNKGFFFKK